MIVNVRQENHVQFKLQLRVELEFFMIQRDLAHDVVVHSSDHFCIGKSLLLHDHEEEPEERNWIAARREKCALQDLDVLFNLC